MFGGGFNEQTFERLGIRIQVRVAGAIEDQGLALNPKRPKEPKP